jgi:hypothetical protein
MTFKYIGKLMYLVYIINQIYQFYKNLKSNFLFIIITEENSSFFYRVWDQIMGPKHKLVKKQKINTTI